MPIHCFPNFAASKQIVTKIYLFATLVTVLSVLGSCGGGGGGIGELVAQVDPVVASVSISPDDWTAARGQERQLTATAFNASGYPIPGVQFVWESSATDVAQVSPDGNVKILFLAGSAEIAATADGKVGSMTIEVTPAVISVKVSPDSWTANRIGQRQQLTATAYDTLGDPIPDVQFTWESFATDIVRVDQSGVATAYSAGAAEISATAESETGIVSQTVVSEVESDAAGIMYTVWFARSDDAPALLVDGNLVVLPDMFCLKQTPDDGDVILDWEVCPWDAKYSVLDYKISGRDPDTTVNDENGVYLSYPNPPNPTTPWSYGSVAKFQWFGDRVGVLSDVLDGQGTLRVLDRHEEWRILSVGNVSDFQIEGARIGMTYDGGMFAVNDVGVRFRYVASGVGHFQLEGNRIGVILENGDFQINEGSGIELSTIEVGVQQFQLEGNRIGVLLDDGTLSVSVGNTGAFTVVASGVKHFQLEGNRIGVLMDNGDLQAQDGIGGVMTTLASGVQQFQLEGNRIGVLLDDTTFLVTQGIGGILDPLASGVKQMQLQENLIGAVFEDDTFGIWDSRRDYFRTANLGTGSADKVTQMRLVVDVPLPPARTTTNCTNGRVECYDDSLNKCDSQGKGCFSSRTPFEDKCGGPLQPPCTGDGIVREGPTAYYGRFAGSKLPTNRVTGDPKPGTALMDWWWAVNPDKGGGPMDPMDALTMHHDAAYQCPCESSGFLTPTVNWYPENTGDLGGDTLAAKLCVVRYGLENALLTKNGVKVNIAGSTRADWGGLGKLYDVIYTDAFLGPLELIPDLKNQSYWTGSAEGCPTLPNLIPGVTIKSGIEKFTEATKAKHNN